MDKLAKLISVVFISSHSFYISADTLNESISHVLKTHPDILNARASYKGSLYQIDQVNAGFLPTVDLTGEIGQQKLDSESTRLQSNDKRTFTPYDLEVSLKQNIFNGFKTKNKKIGAKYDAEIKYLDLVSTQKLLTLKTSKAFIDVIKSKNLLDLAEKNLITHEETFAQIKKIYDQGLSSESDLSQVEGRLSQSKVFVLTALQNLEDAMNEYFSFVNKTAHDLEEPESINIPFKNKDEAIAKLDSHPLILSSKEKIKLAKAVYDEGKSSFYPVLDFSVTHNRRYDQNANIGHEEDFNALLTVGYNLFKGGADKAVINGAASQLETAYAEHSNLYRDLILDLKKSWNKYEALNGKRWYLLSYEENSQKTMDSYKRQFDIGQRTLLDVLNSANELFQARRSLVSLYYDLMYTKLEVVNNSGLNIYN